MSNGCTIFFFNSNLPAAGRILILKVTLVVHGIIMSRAVIFAIDTCFGGSASLILIKGT